MHWTNKYIDIQFKDCGRDIYGLDCWGLVCEIYKNELGIFLPQYTGEYLDTESKKEISLLMNNGKNIWNKINSIKEFDIVLFNISKFPCHVGIMIDNNSFIHIYKGIDSCIEKLDSIRWRKRIEGIYRHDTRMQRA